MENVSVPHSHAPYKGDGSGSYSDHTVTNYTVMDRATPFMMTALENIEFGPETKRPFTIADYGTADGGTSMLLISQIIGKIKERYGNEQEVQVYYEDQPNADYNSLFLRLHGLSVGTTTSYLQKYGNIFTAACGTSFYVQCFPTESVHLGVCAIAVHWLSHRPCVLNSSLFWAFSSDATEKKTFAEAAKKDWELFLMNRAKELVPGGHLVMANMGINAEGQFAGHTLRVKQSRQKMFHKYWNNMVKDGTITQKEFENTTFNLYFRTEGEFAAPFEDTNSAVYKSGLRLHTMNTIYIPCSHNLSWINSSDKDDMKARREYAQKFLAEARAWSNSTFMSGLGLSRSEEDKCRIVDELFSRYEEDIVKAPEEHAANYVLVFMIIQKESA